MFLQFGQNCKESNRKHSKHTENINCICPKDQTYAIMKSKISINKNSMTQ